MTPSLIDNCHWPLTIWILCLIDRCHWRLTITWPLSLSIVDWTRLWIWILSFEFRIIDHCPLKITWLLPLIIDHYLEVVIDHWSFVFTCLHSSPPHPRPIRDADSQPQSECDRPRGVPYSWDQHISTEDRRREKHGVTDEECARIFVAIEDDELQK